MPLGFLQVLLLKFAVHSRMVAQKLRTVAGLPRAANCGGLTLLFSARLRPEKALYPLRKLTALCQEQPPLLHFQEMLDGVRVEGGFGLPVARLGAAKALSHSVAKIRQHGKQPTPMGSKCSLVPVA